MNSKWFAGIAGAVTIATLVTGFAVAAELKSGPQVGDRLPGPFKPLNVNGPTPGEKQCLVCRNGSNPVIMVFASNAECEMTRKLLKEIDAITAKNEKNEMGSFVVFLTEDDKIENQLTELTKNTSYKKLTLSIDDPAGPKGYKIHKDADVTVVLYTEHTIKANHAFKKGELKEKDIETILKDVTKIVPTSK